MRSYRRGRPSPAARHSLPSILARHRLIPAPLLLSVVAESARGASRRLQLLFSHEAAGNRWLTKHAAPAFDDSFPTATGDRSTRTRDKRSTTLWNCDSFLKTLIAI